MIKELESGASEKEQFTMNFEESPLPFEHVTPSRVIMATSALKIQKLGYVNWGNDESWYTWYG